MAVGQCPRWTATPSQIGIDVLKKGGTAADAAVAVAAALGVTEPYSAGIGGGGFFVYYDAKTGKVTAVDGRETAPMSFNQSVFANPDGTPMDFFTVVSSGLSIGTPGTPATWDLALQKWGKYSIADMLAPAQQLAYKGFTVDQTFYDQTQQNAARFAKFPATAKVFLPGGAPPAVGSTFKNRDLGNTYGVIRRQGIESLYTGKLAKAIVAEAQAPHTAPGVSVLPGQLTLADLAAYRAYAKKPITSIYRGSRSQRYAGALLGRDRRRRDPQPPRGL